MSSDAVENDAEHPSLASQELTLGHYPYTKESFPTVEKVLLTLQQAFTSDLTEQQKLEQINAALASLILTASRQLFSFICRHSFHICS